MFTAWLLAVVLGGVLAAAVWMIFILLRMDDDR
jgi:hypothetical protein